MLDAFETLRFLDSEHVITPGRVLVANFHHTPKLPAPKLVDFHEITRKPSSFFLVSGLRSRPASEYSWLYMRLPCGVGVSVRSLAVESSEEGRTGCPQVLTDPPFALR